jgi:hypothetical protein
MELENIILSEVSETQKAKSCIVSLICGRLSTNAAMLWNTGHTTGGVGKLRTWIGLIYSLYKSEYRNLFLLFVYLFICAYIVWVISSPCPSPSSSPTPQFQAGPILPFKPTETTIRMNDWSRMRKLEEINQLEEINHVYKQYYDWFIIHDKQGFNTWKPIVIINMEISQGNSPCSYL